MNLICRREPYLSSLQRLQRTDQALQIDRRGKKIEPFGLDGARVDHEAGDGDVGHAILAFEFAEQVDAADIRQSAHGDLRFGGYRI